MHSSCGVQAKKLHDSPIAKLQSCIVQALFAPVIHQLKAFSEPCTPTTPQIIGVLTG